MGDSPGAPSLSRAEKQILRQQLTEGRYQFELQKELEPFTLEQMRLRRTEEGGIEKIPYEEYLAGLDPDQRAAAASQREAGFTTLRALRGELSDPATEREFARERSQTHETLIASGIAPGSTAYNRAMAEVGQTQALTRKDLGIRDLATLSGFVSGGGAPGVAASPFGGQGQDFYAGPASTLAGLRSARQQHEQQRFQTQQGAVAAGAGTGATVGSSFGPYGTIAGAVIGGAAGYYGSQ